MRAIRGRHAYDGESFLGAGATVLIEDGSIIGVESYGFEVSGRCPVTGYEGTLLPGLIDAHAHLVADSGVSALDRVAGYSAEEIEEVISGALRDQLVAGVTTVRDLGDRRFCVVDRRDRQLSGPVTEPIGAAARATRNPVTEDNASISTVCPAAVRHRISGTTQTAMSSGKTAYIGRRFIRSHPPREATRNHLKMRSSQRPRCQVCWRPWKLFRHDHRHSRQAPRSWTRSSALGRPSHRP